MKKNHPISWGKIRQSGSIYGGEMKAIVNGTILLPNAETHGKALLFDEKIIGIKDENSISGQADEIIDAEGNYISPGLVDVHIHGYKGTDVSDDDPDGVCKMAHDLLENGVTCFLPTTLTVDWAILESICRHMRELSAESKRADFPGAEIAGIHLEGPFINPQYKGAQNEDYILEPDAGKVLPFADIIKVITLAPEMPGALDCIRTLKQKTDIRLSMGHSGASFEEAMAGVGCGITRTTHLFNAMTQLIHRQPGVVGASLSSDVYTELIADTFHVSKGIYPFLTKAKKDRLVLITDALRSAGMPDGTYENGGQLFTLKGIECRLQDGTIAGSVLRLNQGVKNLRDYGNIPLFEAIKAASQNAAESAGLDSRKGALLPGKDADIVIMDRDCNVRQTYVRGVCKFDARSLR